MKLWTPSDYPTGGEQTDEIECVHCGSTDTVWEEYGTSESDDSELAVTCNTCDGDNLSRDFDSYNRIYANPEKEKIN